MWTRYGEAGCSEPRFPICLWYLGGLTACRRLICGASEAIYGTREVTPVGLITTRSRQDEPQRINNSTMQTILLDSNIYDKLWSDENTRLRLASLILHSKVHVIATPKIVDELTRSPFKGVPDWFDVDEEIEAVAVVGHARVGMARLGSGNVLYASSRQCPKS